MVIFIPLMSKLYQYSIIHLKSDTSYTLELILKIKQYIPRCNNKRYVPYNRSGNMNILYITGTNKTNHSRVNPCNSRSVLLLSIYIHVHIILVMVCPLWCTMGVHAWYDTHIHRPMSRHICTPCYV